MGVEQQLTAVRTEIDYVAPLALSYYPGVAHKPLRKTNLAAKVLRETTQQGVQKDIQKSTNNWSKRAILTVLLSQGHMHLMQQQPVTTQISHDMGPQNLSSIQTPPAGTPWGGCT